MGTDRPPPSRPALLAGFAVIYFVWGSTYLAIGEGVKTLPPFLMAGSRFLLSAAGFLAWAWARGGPRPSARQWRNTAAAGVLMFVGGNGGVSYAQQWLASGLAALVVATVPAWLLLFDWLAVSRRRPRAVEFLGLALGLGGVGVLTLAGHSTGATSPVAVGVVVAASAAWAAGSLFARGADLPASPVTAVGMEMLAGGVGLTALGLATGEAGRFDPAAVSAASAAAYAYLVAAGLLALPVYTWLLTVASPAAVGTYAFVNPVVALFLGWQFRNETLTADAGGAAALVVLGVGLITWPRKKPPDPA